MTPDEDLYLRSLFAHNSPEACASFFKAANQEKQLRGVEGGYHTLYLGCLLKTLTKPSEPLNYCLPAFVKDPNEVPEVKSEKNESEEDELMIKLKKVNECIGSDVNTTTKYLEELDRVVSKKPSEVLTTLNRNSSLGNDLQLEKNDTEEVIKRKVGIAVESNCLDTLSEIEAAKSLDTQAFAMFKANLCLFSSMCKREFRQCLATQDSHRGFAKCLENKDQMECFKTYKEKL